MKKTATIAALAILAACAGEPVIADISQDKVQVQANGARPEQIQATADQACAMYHRRAQVLSHRCGDQYCIQKIVLFACIPPQTSALGSTTGYASSSERVICSFPGAANPNLARVEMAASACIGSGGAVVPAGAGEPKGLVYCNYPNSTDPAMKRIAVAPSSCTSGGGTILGPAG